jgi:hypothetical protein
MWWAAMASALALLISVVSGVVLPRFRTTATFAGVELPPLLRE